MPTPSSQATTQPPPIPALPGQSGGGNAGTPAGTPAASTPGATGVVQTSRPDIVQTIPTTRAELDALRSQRGELSDQLTSAAGRREDLAKQLRSASGADRAGLEARIAELDNRIVLIERDIASTGRLLAAARGTLTTRGDSPFPPGGGFQMNSDFIAIPIVFTIFVLSPLAIALSRFLWKRASTPKAGPSFERDNNERLQRLEQSVDTIAIEMERVSEGQRFVTKLLSERAEKARLEA